LSSAKRLALKNQLASQAGISRKSAPIRLLIGRVVVLLIWGAHDAVARWRCQAVVLCVFAVAAALLCTGLTCQQIGYWKDDETLWSHALAVTEDNDFANHNLGAAYFNQAWR